MDKKIRIIKETSSLCPLTRKAIKASILEEDGNIYLIKNDYQGNSHKELLEKDSLLYKCVYQKTKLKENYKKIILDVTYSCNLNCRVCYRNKKKEAPSLKEIEKIANRLKGMLFLLSGGEPTVREDLPRIIRMLTKNNGVILLTNGIKLADLNYLYQLKKNGLKHVSLAFNGFNDEVYEEINGKRLLKIKIEALTNLKRMRMNTVLSFLLVRDINEDQIEKTFLYYLRNRDFIKELRIRSMVPVGRYIDKKRYCLSEMLDLISDRLNINKDDVMREIQFKKAINKFFGKDIFMIGSCHLDFCFKVGKNEIVPFGKFIKKDQFTEGKGMLNAIYILRKVLKLYGIQGVFLALIKLFLYSKIPFLYNKDIIKIGLRSWPDLGNIDLNEICQTGYVLGDRMVPFCHANVEIEEQVIC